MKNPGHRDYGPPPVSQRRLHSRGFQTLLIDSRNMSRPLRFHYPGHDPLSISPHPVFGYGYAYNHSLMMTVLPFQVFP